MIYLYAWTIVLVALLITVFIHELAHMLIALACGVKVEAFSIGFGKVLLHKKLWNIDFRLSLIPLGGYCRLKGEKSVVGSTWLSHRYLKKLAIVLAGVTANFLLAILLYYICYGSITIGLKLDLNILKYIFTKNQEALKALVYSMSLNPWIVQITIMNLFAAITNLIPLPPLDGSYPFTFLLEKVLKKNFRKVLKIINLIGFVLVMMIQVILLYWILIV